MEDLEPHAETESDHQEPSTSMSSYSGCRGKLLSAASEVFKIADLSLYEMENAAKQLISGSDDILGEDTFSGTNLESELLLIAMKKLGLWCALWAAVAGWTLREAELLAHGWLPAGRLRLRTYRNYTGHHVVTVLLDHGVKLEQLPEGVREEFKVSVESNVTGCENVKSADFKIAITAPKHGLAPVAAQRASGDAFRLQAFAEGALPFAAAAAACRTQRGRLALPRSREQVETLAGVLRSANILADTAFLGMRIDTTTHQLYDDYGDALDTETQQVLRNLILFSQSKMSGGLECVGVSEGGDLVLSSCNAERPFFCEAFVH